MNAKTREAIETHGKNLLRIFPNATEQDPLALCKKLRRIETVAHRNSEAFCNGEIDSETYERARDRVYVRLDCLVWESESESVDDDGANAIGRLFIVQ